MDKQGKPVVEDYKKIVENKDRKKLIKPKNTIDNLGFKIGIILLGITFIALILSFFIINYVVMPHIIGYGKEIKVPDITGMKVEKAGRILRNSGLDLRVSEEVYSDKIKEGYIISQTPLPNTKIKFNKTIEIVVSKGVEKTSIPYVSDLFIKDAVDLLKQSGFIVADTIYTFSDDIDENNAISTDPPADILIPKGSKIILYVSRGKKSDYVKLPSFVGLTPDSAQILARKLKIVIGEMNKQYGEVDRPTIVMQSPDSGVYVEKRDTIILTIQVPSVDVEDNE